MNYRKATKEDLPFIVQLIADDKLGQQKENYFHREAGNQGNRSLHARNPDQKRQYPL